MNINTITDYRGELIAVVNNEDYTDISLPPTLYLQLTTKIMKAKLRIEEAGLISKTVWPSSITEKGAKIKVVVDIERTAKYQETGVIDPLEYAI